MSISAPVFELSKNPARGAIFAPPPVGRGLKKDQIKKDKFDKKDEVYIQEDNVHFKSIKFILN